MMYYTLKPSLDRKTVGIYDQIESIEKVVSIPYPQFNSTTGKYDDDTIFPIYKMENKAKHTDLLSNVPLIYLCKMISTNFYEFLKQFKLPEHQIFQGQFAHKKVLYENYKIIFFVRKESTKQCVDWENSFL